MNVKEAQIYSIWSATDEIDKGEVLVDGSTMEPSRADFCHPYQPYSIQLEFMQQLYRCIEDKKVGIFESPTGTGKSLSLICGALTWLRDHERQSLQGDSDPNETEDWLVEAERSAQRRELFLVREEFERKLAGIRNEEAHREDKKQEKGSKRPRTVESTADKNATEDDFVLDDYDSDNKETAAATDLSNGFSSATQTLLDKLQAPLKKETQEQEEDRLKIIFCSRTHSQLTQFVHELRRVKVPSSLPSENAENEVGVDIQEGVKHLALGSRKNLCINDKVVRLPSTTAVNEQCLELQKPGTAKDRKCCFLPSKNDKDKVAAFRDRVIARIRDIEDVAGLGRDMKVCPYYASRSAISTSEVLTLPYPLLLQKSAREALGVSVKDNVVIIDEAHNLMDAIADTLSVSLRLTQLELAVQQVTAYALRFKSRLKGKNRVYVMQVIRLLNSITDCLKDVAARPVASESALTVAMLMSGKGVDQIRPHKLLQYLHESKLCHKVEGYSEASAVNTSQTQSKGVLMNFQNFLAVLMNPDSEGRFFANRQDNDVVVRYTLLDPREHFRDIVQEARAVILAGGTMSPMSDYSDYLFSYLDDDRLQTFSFGHVIPPSNLLAQAVGKGPSGLDLEFTYEKRGSEKTILELGDLILQACGVVSDGLVVFFPSYDYLAQVVAIWQRLPASRPITSCLDKVKSVFQETKSVPVDELLRDYAVAIDTGKGGLMLSVVGGKLSEGINFSDKLGRAVIAVGLPFPNANGAEWKAKMQHIEEVRYNQRKLEGKGEAECRAAAKSASREHYENACMRSVNQSIGRAIRHKDDYAAILLVDRRFSTERIRSKLPRWIQGSMGSDASAWSELATGLQEFFRGKQ